MSSASVPKSELKERLSRAKARARELRERVEQHYRRNGEHSLSHVASSLRVDPLGQHSLRDVRKLTGHFGKVYAAQWAGDAQPHNLVSASQDGKLIVWNAMTANKVHAITLSSPWVLTCAYEPVESNMVACGGLDNQCSVYRLGAAAVEAGTPSVELAQHDGYLSCARFVDESRIVTSSGDSTCILWDVATSTPLRTFSDHSADVTTVAISPDRSTFVSGSCDTTSKLWDMREERCVKTFIGHISDINSVAFFPGGTAFGTGSDDSTCRMFDIRACAQVAEYRDDQLLSGVTSLAYSKSGRLMFAGVDGPKTHVWDVLHETRQRGDLGAHEKRVSCVDVSPDGRALCTGSWDTTLVVWSALP